MGAGLADGINPCAFTVLLFFFSYLSLRQKSYGKFLAAGAVFILAVFLTYLAIGFGLYSVLGAAVSRVYYAGFAVRAAASVLAAVFALLSIRDYYAVKRLNKGEKAGVFLKLPDSVQEKIHSVIRTNIRASGMLAAVFAAGVIVSFLELACTGQVYLPAIAYILQRDSFAQGVFLLVLYNTAFILPMAAVYAVLAFGMNLDPLIKCFQKRMAETKLLLAFVFILLASAVWFL